MAQPIHNECAVDVHGGASDVEVKKMRDIRIGRLAGDVRHVSDACVRKTTALGRTCTSRDHLLYICDAEITAGWPDPRAPAFTGGEPLFQI